MTQIHPTTVPTPVSILIINPNTTVAMTHALEPAVASLGLELAGVAFSYFTCPSTPSAPGIPSINSPADALASAEYCLPHLQGLIAEHNAFLIACYSLHPLVGIVKALCHQQSQRDGRRRVVTGIFEASVLASLNVTGSWGHEAVFGIVSTGKVWEEALASAVEGFIGARKSSRFVGCETTGLNASELHDLPAEEVREKMMEATKRLVTIARSGGGGGERVLRAVCLGCAGMVGLETAVREALMQEMGEVEGRSVAVVDGVKAGVGELVMLVRGGF